MVKNVRSGRRAQVIISPKNFVKIISTLFSKNYGPKYEMFITKVANDTVKTMKEHVPIRTGRLRDSIRVSVRRTQGGNVDKRATVQVGPTVGYARFVDRGTASSPGRFVPELGRRITTGRHPGIPASGFTEKTANDMNDKMPGIFQKSLLRPWRRDWKRRLRPKR